MCGDHCRREVDGQATLLGFVGTPWTLAAYAMEGKADRDCKQTKVRPGLLSRWSTAAAVTQPPGVGLQVCTHVCPRVVFAMPAELTLH